MIGYTYQMKENTMTLTWTADFGDNKIRTWDSKYTLCEIVEVFNKAQRGALNKGQTLTFVEQFVTYSVKA
jgi:hypothetical protein